MKHVLEDLKRNSEKLRNLLYRNFSTSNKIKSVIGIISCCANVVFRLQLAEIRIQRSWVFNTNPELKVNATFMEVNLAKNRADHYEVAESVTSMDRVNLLVDEFLKITASNKDKDFRFSYFIHYLMGKRDIFTIISSHQFLEIVLICFPSAMTKLNIFFTTIDTAFIKGFRNKFYERDTNVLAMRQMLDITYYYYQLQFGQNTEMRSFYIIVNKLTKVLLRLILKNKRQVKELELHDGPSEQSPLVEFTGRGYSILSTFQAYLKIYANSFDDASNLIQCNIVELKGKFNHYKIIDQTWTFNQSLCALVYTHCIINVTTKHISKHLNVSLTDMTYNGPNIMSCYFGGISYFEFQTKLDAGKYWIQEDDYVQTKTFCDSYTHKPKNSSFDMVPMDVVTVRNYVLIVIYGPHPYTKGMKVRIRISITPCKGILPCDYSKHTLY